LTRSEGRRFAFTLVAAFGFLAGLMWWRGSPHRAVAFGLPALALLLAGAAIPTRLGVVRSAWMGLAHAISRITTPIFMGVVYFLVITPSGVLRRLCGGDPLRKARGRDSGWIDRRNSPRGDLTRQF
jgi:hypothetical protein